MEEYGRVTKHDQRQRYREIESVGGEKTWKRANLKIIVRHGNTGVLKNKNDQTLVKHNMASQFITRHNYVTHNKTAVPENNIWPLHQVSTTSWDTCKYYVTCHSIICQLNFGLMVC